MAVLVTGGLGFIPSWIVDELLMGGSEVIVLDNMSTGNKNNLKRWTDKRWDRLQIVEGDIKDFNLVKRLTESNVSCIFHCAANARIQPLMNDCKLAFDENVIGTLNVLEAAKLNGVKRVVYSASSSAYGNANKCPLKEDMKTDCLNPYSLSKKTGEDLMDLYNRLYGLSTVSLRYFNVYGPRHLDTGAYATVIAIFRRQKRLGQKLTVVGDGTKKRDMTFVSDVVRANMMAFMNREVTGVINIGTGKNYSINQVAEMVGGEVKYIEDRPAEAMETLADITKAKQLLGWEPQISLKQGLEITDLYEKRNDTGNIILVGG